MKTKVALVKAYFVQINATQPLLEPTSETRLDPWGKNGAVIEAETNGQLAMYSDCEIDSARLAQDLETAINDLNAQGYELKEVVPILSAKYNYKYEANEIYSNPRFFSNSDEIGGGASYGYGYGYSYTDSLLVIAQANS